MWWLAAVALGFRNGYHWHCNRVGHTIPPLSQWPRTLDASAAFSMSCVDRECTLSGNVSFRGFVISSRDSTLSSLAATPTSDGYCLTHPNPTLKTSVTFTVAGPTVVWATVVTAKVGAHRYALTDPQLVSSTPDQIMWVVGGGPGGLAAARYAHETLGIADVRVLEAGRAPLPGFYDQPISQTGLEQLKQNGSGYSDLVYTPITPSDPSESSVATLIAILGGLQNVNGAVFSPGTAEDLAASTGMPVEAAREAQAAVARYVYQHPTVVSNNKSPVKLMQQCLDGTNQCRHQYTASTGVEVGRRSIASGFLEFPSIAVESPGEPMSVTVYAPGSVGDGFAGNESVGNNFLTNGSYNNGTGLVPASTAGTITINTSCNVSSVTNDQITLHDGRTIDLRPADRVIVAAGALTSPQLVGKRSFSGFNHYYLFEPIGCSRAAFAVGPDAPGVCTPLQFDWQGWLNGNKTQIFDYRGDYEYNYAMLDFGGAFELACNITIMMKPVDRSTFSLDGPSSNAEPTSWTQSWHYMGTVEHTRMLIFPRVYSGDAGALKTPFNCHTSMPAAAAGVLGVRAALGLTLESPPPARRPP